MGQEKNTIFFEFFYVSTLRTKPIFISVAHFWGFLFYCFVIAIFYDYCYRVGANFLLFFRFLFLFCFFISCFENYLKIW